MEIVELLVETRGDTGKGAARRLRRSGAIPAIFYGGAQGGSTTVSVAVAEFMTKLSHLEGSHLIRLVQRGDGGGVLHDKIVLLREVQRHPVTGNVLHADLYEVNLNERITVSVPLRFVGKASGVVLGGILQPILREIELECLPMDIPEAVQVDVSALGIHEAVHVGDIQLPPGVTARADAGQTVVTVLPPTVEEAKAAAEAPEVAPVEGAPAGGAAAPPAGEAAGGGKKGAGE